MRQLKINNEMLVNIINNLSDEIEENPSNYDLHSYTQQILIRELARRSQEEKTIKIKLIQLKDNFYKNKLNEVEKQEIYEEIQLLTRKIKEM